MTVLRSTGGSAAPGTPRSSSASTLTWRLRSHGRATPSATRSCTRSPSSGRLPAAAPKRGRVNPDVERFRRDWDDAYRRLELASQDPARAEQAPLATRCRFGRIAATSRADLHARNARRGVRGFGRVDASGDRGAGCHPGVGQGRLARERRRVSRLRAWRRGLRAVSERAAGSRRPPRRSPWPRRIVLTVLALMLFAIGIALGESLERRPTSAADRNLHPNVRASPGAADDYVAVGARRASPACRGTAYRQLNPCGPH